MTATVIIAATAFIIWAAHQFREAHREFDHLTPTTAHVCQTRGHQPRNEPGSQHMTCDRCGATNTRWSPL